MPVVVSSSAIDPCALTDAQRDSLVERMWACHEQIFSGVSRDDFRRYVVESPAGWNRIQLYTDEAGAVVGYCALHAFTRRYRRQTTQVYRIEVGMLPEHRGGAACGLFIASCLVQQLVRWPLRQHVFFGSLVHPSAYSGLARHIDTIWPHPRRETPDSVQRFMAYLGDSFGLPRVQGADPLIRQVGWVTRHGRVTRARSEAARAYLSANPGYSAGQGMLTLIPISLAVLLRGLGGHLLRRARRSGMLLSSVGER